jgi:hypothetical protein
VVTVLIHQEVSVTPELLALLLQDLVHVLGSGEGKGRENK